MPLEMPRSDTSRSQSIEREEGWPDEIAIAAKWGKKRVELVISPEQFFGHGAFGAPITGQWLIAAIDRLRKARPIPEVIKPKTDADLKVAR